jgi:oligosaccharide 4-alpha-D-glucosyltransferase
MKRICLCMLIGLCQLMAHSTAQVVRLDPPQAGLNDSVTITYNAALGNGALAQFTGDVYLHTGMLTPQSSNINHWFYIVGNWGQADSNVLMTRVSNNIYTKRIHIASYYHAPPGTVVLNLAFVFRNAGGTIVGRSSNNNDIVVPLQLWSPGQYISHSFNGHQLQVEATRGRQYIDLYEQGVRVHYRPDTLSFDSSYAAPDSLLRPRLPATLIDSPTHLSIALDSLHSLQLNKSPLSLSLLRGTDTLFAEQPGWEISSGGPRGTFRLRPGEALFGGGFRTQDVNLRGKRFNLYNQAQYGYGNGAQNLNTSIPFFVSDRGYGLLIDNHRGGVADLGNSDPTALSVEMEGGPGRYWIITGRDYKHIMENYTGLTGRQELPPRWALGYIQSRYGYQTETEARNVVTQMQQQNFPLSALVLDLYWFGSPATMGNLSWDNTRFPNPTGMINTWQNTGVKTILITETYFTQNSTHYNQASSQGYFATNSTGQTYNLGGFWAGSSALLDLTNPAVRPWFMNFYTPRIQEGVEGWWCDLGEPESHPNEMQHTRGTARQIHNLYSLHWAEWLHTHYRNLYPNKRLFNLIRSGYAGMQRYSTFPWSGDVQRSWNGLQAQIPAILNMGMSGVGYMHSDIGGFTGGGQQDELYARWQQFGAFQPIQRVHGEGVPMEPIFYPTNIKNIVREYAQLRMRLLPYNYSLAWENSRNGTPLMRPLWMESGGFSPIGATAPQPLAQNNDQFCWGPSLMVAPVLQQGQTNRSVVMPPGRWFDWWTDLPVAGNSTITAQAPLTRMPIYVRADAFVPMAPVVNAADRFRGDTLELHYYPSDSTAIAAFTLYLDDGESRTNPSTGQFRTLSLQGRHALPAARLSVEVAQSGGYAGEPARRVLQHFIHRIPLPAGTPITAITAGVAAPLSPALSLANFNTRDSVYWYDAAQQLLRVKYGIDGRSTRLEIGVAQPLTGNLLYANPSLTPMAGSRIALVDSLSGQVLLRDTTDVAGAFGWPSRPTAGYRPQVEVVAAWGGCNATDALQIGRATASLLLFNTIQRMAADVNGNGIVNSTDALLLMMRTAGLSSSFSASDWVVHAETNTPLQLRVLCRGDVNGSYQPVTQP